MNPVNEFSPIAVIGVDEAYNGYLRRVRDSGLAFEEARRIFRHISRPERLRGIRWRGFVVVGPWTDTVAEVYEQARSYIGEDKEIFDGF